MVSLSNHGREVIVRAFFCAVALVALAVEPGICQEVVAAPSPVAGSSTAVFHLPQGWTRIEGTGTVAEWRSPSRRQSIRIAQAAPWDSSDPASGIQEVKTMTSMFIKDVQTAVFESKVCGGTQPAIRAVGKGANDKIVFEMIVVNGTKSSAVVTYGIFDGSPVDPVVESTLASFCWQ